MHPRLLLLIGLLLPLTGCLSPSGKLGEDAAAYAQAERQLAFDALAQARTLGDPAERRGAEDALRARFTTLALQLPFDADVRAALGALAVARGDRQAARRHLGDALRLDPGHAAAATLQARTLAEAGDLAGAGTVLETAVLLTPRDPELLLASAHLASLEGDADRALELLEQALDAGAEPWRVAFDEAVVHEFAGRLTEASGALDRARELAPDPELVPVR